MEKRVEVKTYKVYKICPVCKNGEMNPNGMVYTLNPAAYEHICNCCGHKATFRETYPRIEYKEI